MKYLISALSFFFYLNSFSQLTDKIHGTWVYSGNNVYMYDFADAGKVSVTTAKENGLPTLIDDGWRVAADSVFYLKEKKKNSYRENAYQLLEVSSSKMVLFYPANDYKLVFYKVEATKQSKIKLEEDFFINKTFKLEPVSDTLSTKLLFKEKGYCTLYKKGKSVETSEREAHWTILNREDNVFLIIDDFEIFVVKKKNEKKSELELTPYGFLKVITGLDSFKLSKTDN